jgi:hypothetical protein
MIDFLVVDGYDFIRISEIELIPKVAHTIDFQLF